MTKIFYHVAQILLETFEFFLYYFKFQKYNQHIQVKFAGKLKSLHFRS